MPFALRGKAPGSTVTPFTGELDRDVTEAFHTVVVPENTEELRIGMHGTDDGRADFDLSARFDAPPTDDRTLLAIQVE